ncbi:hypothetical protein VIH_003023 [Vibrio cholerae CT 5369-93]|nr:hypothetical protein VIH_003023 [Vibrio cholerae CT 5369-93]
MSMNHTLKLKPYVIGNLLGNNRVFPHFEYFETCIFGG